MFSRKSASGIWKPKNPHSLEYLKYLHGVLTKNAVVTESNRSLLVEALRAIAEILIWGDQNDPSVFDFFLEKNMLGFFLRIMKQKCGRYVCTQLLQTLNILFENISNETSLYYLLSNNHVNSIITHRFDFSDEEILAYYISFLKTLSLKLNGNTVHFFFNEHTNDFPLYTEAIKFFNHSESMVRIAVRTLTLNVYRVNDQAMLSFIRGNTAVPYFSNFVFFIANHISDIDSCVAAGWSDNSQIRDKLKDLIAEHLDHILYVNDIMCLNIDSLNEVLAEQLLKKLFIPIYLCSLNQKYQFEGMKRVSLVMSLFLLSQVFLIITHSPLMEKLTSFLLLGSKDVLRNEGATSFESSDEEAPTGFNNRTDEEKLATQSSIDNDTIDGLENRPLLLAVFNALNCTHSDHAAFYALCLIYSIYENYGISPALLHCAKLSTDDGESAMYCVEIVKRIVDIFAQSATEESAVRVATVDLACAVLKKICKQENMCSNDAIETHLLSLTSICGSVSSQLITYLEHEDIFLDVFEDEYNQAKTKVLSIELLSTDAAMLLPPLNTPLSGVDFIKRLPCGPQEQARRTTRLFLQIRQLLQGFYGEKDDFDRTFNSTNIVKIDDCLNLSNSDLLACTVIPKDGSKSQRFLVTGGLQLMLVEPDSKKIGWGIVRFVGFLQDCEVSGDKEDSRALVVNVLTSAAKARATSQHLLSARLIFDDHIRCMAAKQRLTKGRQKARQYKLDLISRLLGLRRVDEKELALPPMPMLISAPGRQVPGYVAVDNSRRRDEEQTVDDASGSGQQTATARKNSDGKHHAKTRVSRRHVRVLSVESVAGDTSEATVPVSEHIPLHETMVVDAEFFPNNESILTEEMSSKRSSSLSPRLVPRFGVSDGEESTKTSPRTDVSTDQEDLRRTSLMLSHMRVKSLTNEGIELQSVVRDDDLSQQTAPASLQCFSGKRKVTSQVMDI